MRPIDADAFSEQYGNYYAEEGPAEGFIGTVGDLIAKQPTIEAEPVRHGRWVKQHTNYGSKWNCSVCCIPIRAGAGISFEIGRFAFCPFCGARMDATDTNVGGKGDEEMDLSPLDFLAAEYDRKHPHGIRFVDCMEGADDGACKKV